MVSIFSTNLTLHPEELTMLISVFIFLTYKTFQTTEAKEIGERDRAEPPLRKGRAGVEGRGLIKCHFFHLPSYR